MSIKLIINPELPDRIEIPVVICEGDIEAHYGYDEPYPADKWKLRSMIHVVAKNMAITYMIANNPKNKVPWALVDYGMDKYVIAAKGCNEFEEGFYLP